MRWLAKLKEIQAKLRAAGMRVHLDDRDTHKPGWKFNEYELKGVPVRIAMGPRDLENETVELARRDTLEKEFLQQSDLAIKVKHLLEVIQQNLFNKALDFREENTHRADSWEEFTDLIGNRGGFVYAHWGRDSRNRGEDQGNDQGNDPLHSAGWQGRGGKMHPHRCAIHPQGGLR